MFSDELRNFCIVAEELNITWAAAKLHLTQQTLSSQIARLEEFYNVKLFERRRPKLTLTPEGRIFYGHAKAIIEQDLALLKDLDDCKKNFSGSLSVGTTETRAMLILPHVLSEFMEQWENIHVKLNISNIMHLELEQKLVSGELDVIITREELITNRDVVPVRLCNENYGLTLPRKHLETIFTPGETMTTFSALPMEEQNKRIQESGLLNRIPYVYCCRWMADRAKKYLKKHTTGNISVIDMTGNEIIFTTPWYNKAGVFTFDLTARQDVNRIDPDGEPAFLFFPISCPESPEPIVLYYGKQNINPAVKSFVELTQKFFMIS